jgi:hypothetical protein
VFFSISESFLLLLLLLLFVGFFLFFLSLCFLFSFARQWKDLERYSKLTQIHAADIKHTHAGEYVKPLHWSRSTTKGGKVPVQFSEFYTPESLGTDQMPVANTKKPKRNTKKTNKTTRKKRSISGGGGGGKKKNRKKTVVVVEEDDDDDDDDDDFVVTSNKRKRKPAAAAAKPERKRGSRTSSRATKTVSYAEPDYNF